MKKDYFLLLFLLFASYSYGQDTASSTAKNTKHNTISITKEIKGFQIYPNPVSNGIVHINTFQNAEKMVQIFDVLGNLMFTRIVTTKFVNVSKLKPGVYIIKVFEQGKSTTRKLVIE